MSNGIIGQILMVLFMIAMVAVVIFSQLNLAKRKNKWLGLLLPTLAFIISIIVAMAVPIFENEYVYNHTLTLDTEGELVYAATAGIGQRVLVPGAVGSVIVTFLIMNIATLVLFMIYKVIRGQQEFPLESYDDEADEDTAWDETDDIRDDDEAEEDL